MRSPRASGLAPGRRPCASPAMATYAEPGRASRTATRWRSSRRSAAARGGTGAAGAAGSSRSGGPARRRTILADLEARLATADDGAVVGFLGGPAVAGDAGAGPGGRGR